MLRDVVIKYYYQGNGYNYNCSEAMIHAIDEYYGLNLPEQVLYASSGFGGGARHDEMCGGLASAVAALGLLYSVNGRGHDSDKMKELVSELFRRFDEQFSSSRCKYLKEHYYIPDRKCEQVLAVCADILEDIMSNNPTINK